MKPSTPVAMRELIRQIRAAIPVDAPLEDYCDESGCTLCSKKLLEYLSMELENWEQRLDQGEMPNFGDIDRLAKSAKKIHRALKKAAG